MNKIIPTKSKTRFAVWSHQRITYCQGREYFFCSARCLARFQEDLERYAGKRGEAEGQKETMAAPTESKPDNPEKKQDPVCGMVVQPDSPHSAMYKGKNFVFCDHCLDTFQRAPERFVEEAVGAEQPEAEAREEQKEMTEKYLTCPMHPEIQEPVPHCPKCGCICSRRNSLKRTRLPKSRSTDW